MDFTHKSMKPGNTLSIIIDSDDCCELCVDFLIDGNLPDYFTWGPAVPLSHSARSSHCLKDRQ